MKLKFFLFFFLILGIVFITGCSLTGNAVKDNYNLKEPLVVYKSQSCGCCDNYIVYLKNKGFDVKVVNEFNLNPIKSQYGIPANMESCHTTLIGDYFVEGHIPVEAVSKLLNEKPDIKGIALPGMPSASPGMPGSKLGPFIIYSIDKTDNVQEFIRI